MIKKIVLKDIASYDHDGVTFADLQKVNFIYGGNGTGKTTISRLLASSSPTVEFPGCKVDWDDKPVEVLVYNQDFKKRYLKEAMPGVFTFSEDVFKKAPKDSIKIWMLKRKIKQLSKRGGDKIAKEEIERLEKKKDDILDGFMSLKPAVDNVNRMLRLSKFGGFNIQMSSENAYSYQIRRNDGSLVEESLSEGEVTFITFLYFMQMVYSGGNNGDNIAGRVIVIDDPVCSLDADVMFVVSELIQQIIDSVRGRKTPRTSVPEWSFSLDVDTGKRKINMFFPVKGILQIIVLTHNVYFYKQITERQQRDDTRYWKLMKRKEVSIVREYGKENPIRSEYEMLWDVIRKFHYDGDCSVSIQNVMRRIIESYFVIMGGYNKRKLIPDNFSDDPDEMTIVNSLARWADEGSHGFAEDLYAVNSYEMNEKYLRVFERLFVKLGHEAHYRMMMREE